MKRAIRGAAVSVAVLLLSANDGRAKARNMSVEQSNVEAIVTHVDTSDNPGDTDMNTLLRPLSPDTAEAWYDRFWPYMQQEWIDDILVDATKTATYGAACQACAGTGATGTACRVQDGKAYSHHPCPRLFACDACLRDIERTARRTYRDPMLGYMFDRADLTVKAEIFVNNPSDVANDVNPTFNAMKDALLFPRGTCDEGQTDTVCGKRVWVSGWINTDNAHDNRPELHPVSAMIVDHGQTSSGARKLRIGSFIDGSTDWSQEILWWTANYHDLMPYSLARSWRFDTTTQPFTSLFPPRPPTATEGIGAITTVSQSALRSVTLGVAPQPACASPLSSQIRALTEKIDSYDAEIKDLQEQRDHIGPDNQGNVDKAQIAAEIKAINAQKLPLVSQRTALYGKLAACPASKYGTADVQMNFDTSGGSYWVGDVRLEWKVPASIALGATRFGNYSGYLGAAPPNPAALPPPPPVRANIPGLPTIVQGAQCIAPAGTPRVPGLKRWFGWKVAADSVFDNKTANVTWSLPPGATMSPQPPATLTGTKRTDLIIWVPAPQYSATFRAIGKLPDGTTVSDEELLKSPAPRAWIDVKNGAVTTQADGRTYTAKVSASATQLCGDPSSYTYTWTRDGAAAPWRGPGPFEVTLRSGQQAKIEVVVTDSFGAERAADAQVLAAPELVVDAKAACASTVPLDIPTPRGFTAPTIRAASTLCRETKLDATARLLAGDFAFAEATAGRVTFKWDDLKIATEDDGWRWRPIPSTWKVTYPDARGQNRTVLITPDRPTYFQFQTSVTGTDAFGRTASDHVRGDNDSTGAADLRLVLRKLWATWRPGTPAPTEVAVTTSSDPLARRYGAVLGQISRIKPTDPRTLALARDAVRALRTHGFGVVGQARNVAYALPLRPTFTVQRSLRTNVERLTEAAKLDLRRRVPPPAP